MIYLVAYDLNKETRRPDIVGEVKKSSSWAKLSESSYAIDTNETAQQVHDRFKKHLDDNDDFYVIALNKPMAGWGNKDVVAWLNNRLSYARAA